MSQFASFPGIVAGLTTQGTNAARQTIFELNGELYLFNGGLSNAWKWNESLSTWEVDTLVSTFDVAPGTYKGPCAFYFSSELYMIMGSNTLEMLGYKWSNANNQWESNAAIISGLTPTTTYNQPSIFEIDGVLHCILGENSGNYVGYQWNGSAWVTNSSIINGLSDSGSKVRQDVFYKGTDLYLVANNTFAWKWNTVTENWITDTIGTGLAAGNPQVSYFEKGGNSYVIYGNSTGSFSGFKFQVTSKITSLSTDNHSNCLATFKVNLSAPLELGETLTAYLSDSIANYGNPLYEVQLQQLDDLTYFFNSAFQESQFYAFQVKEIWDGSTLQTISITGTFYIMPALTPTVINITEPANYKIFNSPVHAYNHGFLFLNGFVYGSARNNTTGELSDVFKIEAANYANFNQQVIYLNKTESLSRLQAFDQIITAGGFLWVHKSQYLIRINPSDLDYMIFSEVPPATNMDEPPVSDNNHIYLTGGLTAAKINFALLTGTFASYSYTGAAPVAIPAGAIVATCNIEKIHPTIDAYNHSSVVDDLYLYLNVSSSGVAAGFDTNLNMSVCHFQKIRKNDFVTVGNIVIPRSTDDMVQNGEYVFLGPELGFQGSSGIFGSDFGLFAVKKTTLEIKYLKALIPQSSGDPMTNSAYGVFYFNDKITLQNIYNRQTIVIDVSEVESWGDAWPIGGSTDAIFTFQLNGVNLIVPSNELVLDNAGWVHTNTWETNTMIFKFNLSQITTATKTPNIQTSLINLTGNAATLGGYIIDEGQSPITDVGFRYSNDPELLNINVDVTPDTYDFQTLLESLAAGVYFFQAWGTNTEGTFYGNTVMFTVEAGPTYNAVSLFHDSTAATLQLLSKNNGHSIRCVQDAPGVADLTTGTATDQDGNIYNTIVINEKRWFVENLKTTHYLNAAPIPDVQPAGEWELLATGARCSYNNINP